MVDLEASDTNRYRLPQSGAMNVTPELFMSEHLKSRVEADSLKQLRNAAQLPGVEFVAGMPDLHVGYGLPVGGVLGMDDEHGLISAGAVGMDINCGVRLLATDLRANELKPEDVRQLLQFILHHVPAGIGQSSPYQSTLNGHIDSILREGAQALKPLGFVQSRELDHIQDRGKLPGAKPELLSAKARKRTDQLSTLGGGNHFLELEAVSTLFNQELAEKFGLREDTLCVMIHTGSRGFGHQNCVDFSDRMKQEASRFGIKLPDKGLAAAPINSQLGQDYLGAMACAANMAYANRQMIAHGVREAFREFGGADPEIPRTVYDITHNLARFESINDEQTLVHRKGAVRALPAGHPDNPKPFRDTGHPVLIPGNMKAGSFVATAGPRVTETHNTVNHGAGRVMSRRQAKDQFSQKTLQKELGTIQLAGAKASQVTDEAPGAYKNLDDVITSLVEINVLKPVAHLRPLGVIKGD